MLITTPTPVSVPGYSFEDMTMLPGVGKFSGRVPPGPDYVKHTMYDVRMWLSDSEYRTKVKRGDAATDNEKIWEAIHGINPEVGDAYNSVSSGLFSYLVT